MLKTDELILLQTGTSGPLGNRIQCWGHTMLKLDWRPGREPLNAFG